MAIETTAGQPAPAEESAPVGSSATAGTPARAARSASPGSSSTEPADWGQGLGYPDWIEGAMPWTHRAFNVLNKYLSVPSLKMGLGRFMSSPLTGYLMVLRTRGRKSGQWRDAPLGYVVIGDAVYCMAGYGTHTHWFKNIKADPRVEVLLPGRSFSGLAEEVVDPEERREAMVELIRSMAVVAMGFGLGNPRKADAAELERKCAAFPLVRVRATGIAAGPEDYGGWFWIVPMALSGFFLLRWLSRRGRCRG